MGKECNMKDILVISDSTTMSERAACTGTTHLKFSAILGKSKKIANYTPTKFESV